MIFLKDTGLGVHGSEIPALQAHSICYTLHCAMSTVCQYVEPQGLVPVEKGQIIIHPAPDAVFTREIFMNNLFVQPLS